MTTVSNVISDLYFCYSHKAFGVNRCANCSRKNDKDPCNFNLIDDAIEYLRILRNIQEVAEPNDLNWVIDLIKNHKS